MVEKRVSGYHAIVMDFGLARETSENKGLTESGTVMGTPGFMSPEQARGEVRSLDCRTDVYGLGASLYAVLTGQPPFESEAIVNVLVKVMSQDAPMLGRVMRGIPSAIETIVDKCLAKEPRQRYQTALELAEDLKRFLGNRRILGRRLSLAQRLLWKAKNNQPLAAAVLAFGLTLLGFMSYGVRTYVQNLRKERLAKRQVELSQRLGQEMKDMEWLLRTARGMPLHDLNREKQLVRAQMATLQKELAGFGSEGRSVGLYALGRGHMGLHEYGAALHELKQAITEGFAQPEGFYALGVVLGKHYEQAMYEARLAGGGDWAKKRLQEIGPRYLQPAISALKQARTTSSGAPEYLEALIAYYQRDFEGALKQAQQAQQRLPWLYEASKLAGDVHLERALQARDNGKSQEAEQEFAAAVSSFSKAAEIGRSDGEIYDGLAEAWVRQIEMALFRGQPVEKAYAAAIEAADKSKVAEPQELNGLLKRAYAALMTLGFLGGGSGSAQRAQQCIADAEAALRIQPNHPYASDVGAACYAMSADLAQTAGQNPEPLLRKALQLLEPAVQKSPYFLWGMNDLANIYFAIGSYMQVHGNPDRHEQFIKAANYYAQAVSLDSGYLAGQVNLINNSLKLIEIADNRADLESELKSTKEAFDGCVKIDAKALQCYNNYFQICAMAAARLSLLGQDVQPLLQCAFEHMKTARALGANGLDTAQGEARAHVVAARQLLRKGIEPAPELALADAALQRCLAQAATDATCGTLAAQAQWIQSDWQLQRGASPLPALARAQQKALAATQSPEVYPDAWWTLAATELRLARAKEKQAKARDASIAAGLAALQKVFAINANHAQGLATQGALQLMQAQAASDSAARTAAAKSARQSLEQALKSDAFLSQDCGPLLKTAQALSQP